ISFYYNYLLCFFFQAEDGIRDFHVTGVQTCALPISLTRLKHRSVGVMFCPLHGECFQRSGATPMPAELNTARRAECIDAPAFLSVRLAGAPDSTCTAEAHTSTARLRDDASAVRRKDCAIAQNSTTDEYGALNARHERSSRGSCGCLAAPGSPRAASRPDGSRAFRAAAAL